MIKNVGKTDKAIRLLVAAGLVAISFIAPVGEIAKAILAAVIGIFTLTAFTGTCPLYGFFRINSCKKQ